MSNLNITFLYPWLLLLLIPALVLMLLPYFRMSKKYRRTRNRITSMVLYIVVTFLSVLVLSGISFNYDRPNLQNEVLLLVDLSHSNRTTEEQKNGFIKNLLDKSDSRYKVGIVTFGYGQVYAAEFNNDTEKVYQDYLRANRPNDSATDIASALNYSRGLFSNPKAAKIVLLTDGIETDGKAMSVILSIASSGIKVDTVHFSDEIDAEVQIISIEAPDYNIVVGNTANLSVTLQSSFIGSASLTLYDNDMPSEPQQIELKGDEETFEFEYVFITPGSHRVYIEVQSNGDNLTQNNTYYSYLYLYVFDKVLLVDGDGESKRLKNLIEDDYNLTVVDTKNVPQTLNELLEYDEVILVNVSHEDMETDMADFEQILYSYVFEYGGGLLTVGGDKAYGRADLEYSDYQKMLPVDAVDYTPPLGLVIIIDKSGSMQGMARPNNLDLAKEGAIECVNALNERDFCGIVTLEYSYSEEIGLTPMSEKNKIIRAIASIGGTGGTVYSGAIQSAGKALIAANVEKRHILFISDGGPSDTPEEYEGFVSHYYENAGITMSSVFVDTEFNPDGEAVMKRIKELGHGRYFDAFADPSGISMFMREDVRVPEITEYVPEIFTPKLNKNSSLASGIVGDMPELGGFYGTRPKRDVDIPLSGPFVPIYAQWKFGQGRVGSFMCDLNGTWSDQFLTEDNGKRFINNMIKGLFPNDSIRSRDIETIFNKENYKTELIIKTPLAEGDIIEVTVIDPLQQSTIHLPAITGGYTKCMLTFSQPGIYEVNVVKKDKDKNIISEYTAHTTFSYSLEYDVFRGENNGLVFLTSLSENGNGMVISHEQVDKVFRDFVTSNHFKYDPRIPFILTALILFLMDIAVRKFKFKWPWEIIRDRKAQKLLMQDKEKLI